MLLGENALLKLNNSHVAVIGLGGVGSWCAEALARAGVGTLTLIDCDSFSESNINRQIGALDSTIGMEKSKVMEQRVKDINPNIIVVAKTALYDETSKSELIKDFDYVADCIDLVSCKIDLIMTCKQKNIPIITALGTGNKFDATQLCITDISKTKGDPLARVMRKELRDRNLNHLKVVYSPEEPMECEQIETPPPGRRSVPGSLVWVPATAGLLMAQEICKDITGYNAKTNI